MNTQQQTLPCDNLSIGEYRKILEMQGNDYLTSTLIRHISCTYQQFIDLLYKDLDEIISLMQENPELYSRDSEDRSTISIVHSLKLKGYDASHESKIGGHADISVRGKSNHLWLGEAKNHSSYQHLFDGFQQLTTRYTTGQQYQDQGAVLIYIKKTKKSADVISAWKKNLSEREIENLKFIDSDVRKEHVFFTTHTCARTGRELTVRHIGICLYFQPRDQGAKTA